MLVNRLNSKITVFALVVVSTLTAATSNAQEYYDNPLYQWCNRTVSNLERSLDRAINLEHQWRFGEAKRELLQGLRDATHGASGARQAGVLTARAIWRGIDTANDIDKAVAGVGIGDRTVVRYLKGYYQFIIDTANNIDLPYYIPYESCRRCETSDQNEFDTRLLTYARAQVQLVLDNLADMSSKGVVTPVGAVQGYLKALESSTSYATSDLKSYLLSQYNYACAIQDLEELSDRVSNFNSGSRRSYSDFYEAVNSSFREASEILSDLEPSNSCKGSHKYHYPRS